MKQIKKMFAIMLVLMIGLSLFSGCGEKETESGNEIKSEDENVVDTEDENEDEVVPEETSENWKIGIITGTVAQNEEEYRAAQEVQEAMLEKYGEDRVILQTYPEKFMDEQETVIANIAGVASDPDVKVLIICQGVPGTSAAIDKVKETRDDLLIIVGTSGEDPNMISARADISLQMDELGMGTTIIEQAAKQGAKTFVHYSFPRHMSYALLAARRELFKETCDELGLEFVDATAPDPTGDAGVSGAQQFILEDVPKMLVEYGEDTAFFSTNCAMQVPLIKSVYDGHGIYPQPCCPSPYHGFPSALEVNIPEDKKGDTNYLIDEIRTILAGKDMTGRMSTWPVPINMMFIIASADYAVKWIEGDFEEKVNVDELTNCFNDYASEFGDDIEIQVTLLEENGKKFDNYLMILSDFIDL